MGKELQVLIDFGATKIEFNNLASNYYIDFTYNNKKYTVGHILNVYGESTDYWELYPEPVKIFDKLEDILEFINT